jgi:hypothetical protein
MWIVSAAMLDSPSPAVTRSRTTCGAGVANDALAIGPPTTNAPKGPLSEVSQEKLVIGLLRSVEVEASEITSFTLGDVGNQKNDASGAP